MKALLVVFLLAIFLFTFRLLQVPPGIETDEGAISHNAALIAKTLHDQNGRFLPVFILSSDHVDWKQPVLIYLAATYFKVFGPSLLTFKLVNVSLTLVTLGLMLLVLKMLFPQHLVVAGLLVLLTSPLVIIATRMGNEGIDPIFFATLWILALVWYRQTAKPQALALAALALGIGFYSYKGMRLIVPPWAVLTGIYIYVAKARKYLSLGVKAFLSRSILDKGLWRDLGVFGLVLLPFFLVTPFLEMKYAGAIFDRKELSWESYRHYAYFWLSNLDLSFWYTVGDIGKIFSVDRFGVFLLSLLPLFLLGLKKAVEKLSFFTFLVICYFLTPSLFGLAGSIGYGHRLIAIIPLYTLITTLGLQAAIAIYRQLTSRSVPIVRAVTKTLAIALVAFAIFNFLDFCAYYYFYYPQEVATREAFPNNLEPAFRQLAKLVVQTQRTPLVENSLYFSHGEGIQFFEVAYFNHPLKIWTLGEPIPPGSLLLTQVEHIDGTSDTGSSVSPWHILQTD